MGSWEEFTAKTVSDALTEASVSFQVPSSMVEFEVMEEKKNGLLGLFSKPAKIRARVKEENPKKQESIKVESKKQEVKVELEGITKKKTLVEKEPIDVEKVEAIVKKFLKQVFDAMKIEAKISVAYDLEEGSININVDGEDMGILIGKRGQTLDSLQYLTSLVINRETTSYLKVKLDTENYRQRRKETLENLAKNIAYKVKRTKRSVSLEPMNPYERRIIHSALQSDKYVDTHSEGDEPYRRVVVTLKKGYRDYNSTNKNNHYNNNRKDYKKNFSEKENAEVKTNK
ncbi:MAG: RNA-binding cell elongation regulator Jag/EloR [Velocimicrobium sp.]